jgi:predicted nuclease of predicted toxin-antitoxin system
VKILLDECLPLDFRHSFPRHEVHSAEWAGLKSKSNGELLRALELSGYGVLLTMDQGFPHQQNLRGRKVSVILLRAATNRIEDLLPLVDAVVRALERIAPGQVVTVG